MPILTVHDILEAGFAGCDFHVHGNEQEMAARLVREHRETKQTGKKVYSFGCARPSVGNRTASSTPGRSSKLEKIV